MSNEQLTDKVNRLEETLDLIVLTLPNSPTDIGVKLGRAKERAEKRQALRDRENAIRNEYAALKMRLMELESDNPFLKQNG